MRRGTKTFTFKGPHNSRGSHHAIDGRSVSGPISSHSQFNSRISFEREEEEQTELTLGAVQQENEKKLAGVFFRVVCVWMDLFRPGNDSNSTPPHRSP